MIGDIGTIYIIESLSKGELKAGTEIHNDTLDKHYKYYTDEEDKFTYQLFTPSNRKEFFETLEFINVNCEYARLGLLLHFEMHGNSAGIQLSNKEIIQWEEFADIFVSINLKTCNKLYICMASCFGRSIYNSVDISKTSPYCGYISASKAISAQECLSDYTIIYEALLESKNIIMAYEKLESTNKKSNFYYKDTDAVFQEVMQFTFDKIKSDSTYRQDIISKIETDMAAAGIDTNGFEINAILEIVQQDYKKYHYPKFVLKNCKH